MKGPDRRRILPRTDPMPDPHRDDDDQPTARPQVIFDGRYHLLHELGKGGMGVVWVAYDKEQMRGVALKRISKERQDDAGLRERFRREFRALGAIRHPGVPTLYTNGRAPDGTPYFTMELINGDTLHRVLQSAPLDPVFALDVAIQLGKILMAVHGAGIVHRDVKPSNVILEPGGRVRLIDFGACLLLPDFYRRDGIGPVTATAARWGTGEHEVIGTPAYTDPAAMYEKQTTERADIFSVCTILYEAVTGRCRVDRTSQKIHPIQTGAFPPQLARLAAELRRGTDPSVSKRHRSMGELVHALEAIRTDLLRGRMQVEPPPRSRVALVLSSLALASTAAVLLFVALRPVAEPAPPSEAPALTGEVAHREPAATRDIADDTARDIAGDTALDIAGGTARDVAADAALDIAGDTARDDVAADAALELDTAGATADGATAQVLAASGETRPLGPGNMAPDETEHATGSAPPPSTTAARVTAPSTIAALLRTARTALRPCRPRGAPLTVQIAIRVGRATVLSINGDPPEEYDAFQCVVGALARLDFPSTRATDFRTLAL